MVSKEGGCATCAGSREIKGIYEMLGVPQRACEPHNCVQCCHHLIKSPDVSDGALLLRVPVSLIVSSSL